MERQGCLSLLVPFSVLFVGHSWPQRFKRGALRDCLVSETLRQAEGKPEDPLQALPLPARGNPLLLGWEDTEAEGGYRLPVQAADGLSARPGLHAPRSWLVLGWEHPWQQPVGQWRLDFCAVVAFCSELQWARGAPAPQSGSDVYQESLQAFKPWYWPWPPFWVPNRGLGVISKHLLKNPGEMTPGLVWLPSHPSPCSWDVLVGELDLAVKELKLCVCVVKHQQNRASHSCMCKIRGHTSLGCAQSCVRLIPR